MRLVKRHAGRVPVKAFRARFKIRSWGSGCVGHGMLPEKPVEVAKRASAPTVH